MGMAWINSNQETERSRCQVRRKTDGKTNLYSSRFWTRKPFDHEAGQARTWKNDGQSVDRGPIPQSAGRTLAGGAGFSGYPCRGRIKKRLGESQNKKGSPIPIHEIRASLEFLRKRGRLVFLSKTRGNAWLKVCMGNEKTLLGIRDGNMRGGDP